MLIELLPIYSAVITEWGGRDYRRRESGIGSRGSGIGGRGNFSELTPRHCSAHPSVIARSLRRSDLAGSWEVIGHTAGREMGFAAASRCHVANRSLSKTPTRRGDGEEESLAVRWLGSYFDGAQHERRAGFAMVAGWTIGGFPFLAPNGATASLVQWRKPWGSQKHFGWTAP